MDLRSFFIRFWSVCKNIHYLYSFFILFLFFWMIKGTPVNIIVGSHAWAEDPDAAWIDGEVIGIEGRNATIVTTDGKTVS